MISKISTKSAPLGVDVAGMLIGRILVDHAGIIGLALDTPIFGRNFRPHQGPPAYATAANHRPGASS